MKNSTLFIYGVHPIEAALKNNPWRVKQVYIESSKFDHPDTNLIRDLITQNQISYQLVNNNFFKRSYSHFLHQSMVAEVAPIELKSKKELIEKLAQKQNLTLVMIPKLQDPHNLGAMLRTAKALNSDAIILNPNRTPPLNHTVAKVSSGAMESLDIFGVSNLPQLIDELKKNNFWIYGLDMNGKEIQNYFASSKKTNKNILVVGEEGSGLGQLISAQCDELLSIQINSEVESLNASVSFAIALYEMQK